MNQLKDGDFEVFHRSGLNRDRDYPQQYSDDTSTAPISDDDDDAQLLSVNLSEFSSEEDHNLFGEASDSNSDNEVEIIHVQPAIPPYNDHDSELEEKKEAVPTPTLSQVAECAQQLIDEQTALAQSVIADRDERTALAQSVIADRDALQAQLDKFKQQSNDRANLADHQLHNHESPYARCKPMAPTDSPDTKERCKPMAPIKPRLRYTSTEHIDPKMGHLKRVYIAATGKDQGNDSEIRGDHHPTKNWTKVILQHPQACTINMRDTFDLIWDSGASVCITHDKRDFIGPIKPIWNGTINGISGTMGITGCRRVRWSLLDTAGQIRNLLLAILLRTRSKSTTTKHVHLL